MNRLGPHTMPIAPGRVAAPRRTPGGHRGKIFTHVLVIHLLILFGPIGYLAFENWRNPPEENAFRVKIGGRELSHDWEVGPPERRPPSPNPGAAAPEPAAPEPEVPEPSPRVAEPAAPKIAPPPRIKEPAAPKVKRTARQQAKPKTKPKPKTRPKSSAKQSSRSTAKPKSSSRSRTSTRPRNVEEAQRQVYRPGNSGKIGGGSNYNSAVPIGSRDVGQAYGKPDHRTPGGGAKDEFDMRYGIRVGNYLKYRWTQPPRSLLGDRLPEVLIQLSIAADGRVTDARVLKPSGVKAMDESIKRLLANLDRVPTPPNGKVTFQLVMRTE